MIVFAIAYLKGWTLQRKTGGFRTGRTLYVIVHVLLPADSKVDGLRDLDAVRHAYERHAMIRRWYAWGD